MKFSPRFSQFLTIVVLALLAGSSSAQEQAASNQQKSLEVTNGISVLAPVPWFLANRTRNAIEIAYPLPVGQKTDTKQKAGEKPTTGESLVSAAARMAVTVEQRRSHAEALQRLAQIASESEVHPALVVIAGWPAIERRREAPLPNPGETKEPSTRMALFATIAIAVDTQIVRFETVVAPGADPKLAAAAAEIARGVQVKQGDPQAAKRELGTVSKGIVSPFGGKKKGVSPEAAVQRKPSPKPGGGLPTGAGTSHVQGGVGELEVVASDDGQHVLVAANSGFSFSDDAGQTFTFGGGTPCIFHGCDGDPSLAVGKSGAMYYAWIGFPKGESGGIPPDGVTDSLSVSADNGHTFTFRSNAVVCPNTTPTVCQVPDQEHIAADRNALSASSQDRLYLAWRNFSSIGLTARIVCSSDGANTWSAQTTVDAAGDFTRVSVGHDGFVYVAYDSGSNMMLHKFSTCDSGLTPQAGFPVVVSSFVNVPCAVPGLDRCNNGNILSSPTVAEDDLDANHVYVAWATSNGAGNEDVMVADSLDGGLTFPRSVRVNNAVTARRFMPWVSSYGGVAYVNWYDRRNVTAANNDLTRYFGGSAAVKAGNLISGTESDISQVDDTQCSLWPCAPRSTADSESCSVQPQLAGFCRHTPNNPSDSFTRCDFSSTVCPPTETCQTSGGCPKYGDYNGAAALAGRRYAAWSSATPPPGVTGSVPGINVYESSDLLPSDFFVRDWTNSATDHDTGTEPSTNPTFYTTSDVWNQSSSTPEVPVSDWILGDAPIRGGSNFAFARVSRRAPAASTAANVIVTVNFLEADYGASAPFTSIGSQMVTLTAADTSVITPAVSWSVPATASTHLCLAVEITAPGDAFVPPSLGAGGAPGPSDSRILQDNNKAQRNLQETTGTGSAGVEGYALIHNPDLRVRDMTIEFGLDPGAEKYMKGGSVFVVGGQTLELAPSGRLILKGMAPGENRWIGVRFGQLVGKESPAVQARFTEVDSAGPISGFAIGLQSVSLPIAARDALRAEADVLARLAAITKNEAAKRMAEEAGHLAYDSSKGIDPDRYRAFVKEHFAGLREALEEQSEAKSEPFALRQGLADVERALGSANVDGLVLADSVLMQRLDAHLTWHQKERHRKDKD
jgi:hypothetical protein